ncbi:sodium channel protein Nach-like isoform X2 [Hylaeus anthracinus]|uniref:sodium channel protein Nach-like isoform X2 n=1 Tax=Hylaeus anthracinus TaxID=313031 RepID=UPI0023B9002F|nr:sodium channel protein Nach-like isoform X2 [Hylaeus anthracinus]
MQFTNAYRFLYSHYVKCLFSKSKLVDTWNSCDPVDYDMKYNYKPSLRDVRHSLRYRSKEYFLENTLHGVPFFVDPTRPKWERVTWFLLTIASLAATLVVIAIIWNKFQTEPTITGLDIRTEHINIDFPPIFICFEWAQLNHSRLRENEMYIYEQLYNWIWGKNIDLRGFDTAYQNTHNFHSTFEMMAPNCDDVIRNCSYKGIKGSCDTLFMKVLTSVGACCKFKAVEPLTIVDTAWSLQFETLIYPWRLYVSQNIDATPKPGERPLVNPYFPIDIEFIVDITHATSDIRYLTLRQRECYYKRDGVNLNDCEFNCFIEKLLDRCNCLPWFLSFTDQTECPLSKYACLNDSRIEMIQCDCWLSCNHTSYSVKGIVKEQRNVNRIILKNWPTAVYKREMRFGYMDLVVSFGGIASLFLGYSLLTSVEMGYYFSLRTYCGAVIQSSRKVHNIVTVHVVGKLSHKVDADVQPKYYQYLN